MPRYFFHVRDGTYIPDDEGVELPDIAAARIAAIRATGETLRDMGSHSWNGTEWSMEVTNEAGEMMFVLHFSADDRPAVREPISN